MLRNSQGARPTPRQGLRQDLSDAPGYYRILLLLGGGALLFGFALGLGQSIRLLGSPPLNVDATVWGRALFERGELHTAVREFEMAARIDPVGYADVPEIAYPAPSDPKAEQRLAEAQQGVIRNPHEASAHLLLGEAQILTGAYLESAKSLRHAVRLDPRNARAHASLGRAQLLRAQPVLAEQSLRRSHELRSAGAEVFEDWAIALYQQGKLGEAANAFEKASELRRRKQEQ